MFFVCFPFVVLHSDIDLVIQRFLTSTNPRSLQPVVKSDIVFFNVQDYGNLDPWPCDLKIIFDLELPTCQF